MKITFDTKFNIGDTVYAPDHYYDFYANHTPYVVTDIILHVSDRNVRTLYCINQGEYSDHVTEEWLSHTYEECVQWCKEHN